MSIKNNLDIARYPLSYEDVDKFRFTVELSLWQPMKVAPWSDLALAPHSPHQIRRYPTLLVRCHVHRLFFF